MPAVYPVQVSDSQWLAPNFFSYLEESHCSRGITTVVWLVQTALGNTPLKDDALEEFDTPLAAPGLD